MGGGGGRYGLTPDELRTMEELAKTSLKTAAEPTRRNVFLSFAVEDLAEVNLLRGQAKKENSDLEFNDWSLRKPFESKDADYIKRGIRERIRQSSVTVVFVSEHTADNLWVDWEIRESIAMGKGVVAMYAGDHPPRRVPKAIAEHKIQLVPWNHAELSRAIESQAKG